MSRRAWTTEELVALQADLNRLAARLVVDAADWEPALPGTGGTAAAYTVSAYGVRPQPWGRVATWIGGIGALTILLISVVYLLNSGDTRQATEAAARAEAARKLAEEGRIRKQAEEAKARKLAEEAEANKRAEEARAKKLAEEAAEAKRRADALEQQRKNRVVIFRIRSNHSGSVAVQFRSMADRTRYWPARDRMYVLRDRSEQAYEFSCEPGERICFGAWVEGSALNPYWGGGYQVRETCTNCCLTCPAATGWSWTLEPSSAVTPQPTVTWNIRNGHFSEIGLVFYSMSRRGYQWPGGTQEFVIRQGDLQSFRLNCRTGEQICYGAWPRNSPGLYWGVGPLARHGCTRCCHVCDGTDISEITLR